MGRHSDHQVAHSDGEPQIGLVRDCAGNDRAHLGFYDEALKRAFHLQAALGLNDDFVKELQVLYLETRPFAHNDFVQVPDVQSCLDRLSNTAELLRLQNYRVLYSQKLKH